MSNLVNEYYLLQTKIYCMYHTIHLRVLSGSQNKDRFFSLYSINLSVFITEAESVYCAVGTGSLNQTATKLF
jgi:hypothetical protein